MVLLKLTPRVVHLFSSHRVIVVTAPILDGSLSGDRDNEIVDEGQGIGMGTFDWWDFPEKLLRHRGFQR